MIAAVGEPIVLSVIGISNRAEEWWLEMSWQMVRIAQVLSLVLVVASLSPSTVLGQAAPTPTEAAHYVSLHAAAWRNDVSQIRKLIAKGADPKSIDNAGRTPLHVATFRSHDEAVTALIKGGADPNALEHDKYDPITIAAVANDPKLVALLVKLGANPRNITSIYDGTALIAAAHLGHAEVVRVLIAAGAPLDHVNNLGWTALIEAIVLGDGGPDHVATVRALVDAGADKSIRDRNGQTPLMLAKSRGYQAMIDLLSTR